MFQKIIIAGNLGRDPELKYLQDGTPVTSMNVATNNNYTNQKGEQVKETTWFRVSVFGKQAESVSRYMTKGRQVLVEGRLRPDPTTGGPKTFTRQDGTIGSSFEIIANTVRFIGGQRDGAGSGGSASGDLGSPDMSEEDIPFE
jgi:single-strand DNA-binding protein